MKKFLAITLIITPVITSSFSVISCNYTNIEPNIIQNTLEIYNKIKWLSNYKFKNAMWDFENIKNSHGVPHEEINKIIKESNEMLEGNYLLNDDWEMEPSPQTFYFPNEIDWTIDYKGDLEMTYMFSRMNFVKKILKSFIYTEDIKYLNKAISIVKDFEKNEPINEQSISRIGGTWRTMDVGIRLDVLLLLSSILQKWNFDFRWVNEMILLHISYLYSNERETRSNSNWGIFQNVFLLKSILIFNNKDLNVFKNEIISRTFDNIRNQFNEDGVQIEESTMYHNEVLLILDQLKYFELLGLLNLESDFADLYKKSYIYSIVDSDMNNYEYLFGDSDRFSIKRFIEMAYLFLGIKINNFNYEDRNEENNFNFSMIKDIKVQEIDFNYNKYEFKKSGKLFYKTDNYKVAFYNSANNFKGHGHGDLLHFNLDYKFKNFFVDPGRYTYVETPERIRERLYFKKMENHNTIIVNNKPVESFKNNWQSEYEKATNLNNTSFTENNVYSILGEYKDEINDTKISRKISFTENQITISNNVDKKVDNVQITLMIDPEVKIENISDKEISLKNQDVKIILKHEFELEDILILETYFSEKYNHVNKSKKIIFNVNEKNNLFSNEFIINLAN